MQDHSLSTRIDAADKLNCMVLTINEQFRPSFDRSDVFVHPTLQDSFANAPACDVPVTIRRHWNKRIPERET